MRRLFVVIALLIVSSAATAQTGAPASSTSANPARPIPEAPVGHRQPQRDQVPSEKNLSNPADQANKEDAALDRKIKSICRGC
jgi:hypothetical protein